MKTRFTFALAAGVFALGSVSPAFADAPGAAPGPPQRELVYAFTYSSSGDLQEHGSNGYASDTHSGAGNSRDYKGTLSDKGTIKVDVIKEQHDRGLIVMVSEQGQETRSAAAAECVVYGDTINIVCDPAKTVNSEELTLLRFLGTTFLDPNQLDANKHWAVKASSSDRSTIADFTVQSTSNGIMTIGESRTVKDLQVPVVTSNVDAKIAYDFSRSIPVSVDENVIARQNQAGGATMTTEVRTTLRLQTDSQH